MTDDRLTPEAVTAADPHGMLGEVLAQPAQIEDALWRVESAGIAQADRSRGLVVCGMGGSAIGGDLAAAAIGTRATAPITTVRGYELPRWVGPDTLVVCASYSGDTEETLTCFGSAGDAGAPRVAVTTGGRLAAAARDAGVPVVGVPSGMQPRAAVVYMTVAALECAVLAGAAPTLRPELTEAAQLLGQLARDWAPDAPGEPEPKRLAAALEGRIPVVYGGRVTAAVARRWRTQLNENAEVPAFYGELPEAHHNEVVGWHHTDAPLTAVVLEAPGEHERMRARYEVTADVMAAAGLALERVQSRGESPTARVMSLVLLGDLVSVYLAVLLGNDPTPVAEIDALKRRLSER
ncbi:MAG: bifunctional phosphoglucose/phosphomannose isomerase [Thermoleophilaceae bacterium]